MSSKTTSADLLQLTMEGLESGLHVAHIATFELVTCEETVPPEEVFADPRYKPYDYIPVRKEGRIVAVLERPESKRRLLDDTILVSARTPLTRFIEHVMESPYRLVVDEGGITGIVTWSDLQKLPVRLLVFTLITHLEMIMAELIRQHLKQDEWILLLSENRRKKLLEKQEKLKKESLDPPLLELTDFCDKRTIIKKHFKAGRRFEKEFKDIEKLRNRIAHAASFAGSPEGVKAFVDRYRLIEHWIHELNEWKTQSNDG